VPSLDSGDDFVGVGRPREWFGIGVGLSDEAVDGGLEIDDGAEDTTFQSTSAELGEKRLDRVEPGARGWCEVENETRMTIEPRTNVGVFVSCIVTPEDPDSRRCGDKIVPHPAIALSRSEPQCSLSPGGYSS
jgi:hypothetical protein